MFDFSELNCIGKYKDANQICNDCSSPLYQAIICPACAKHCHEGHSISLTTTKKFCSCFHKNRAKDEYSIMESEDEVTSGNMLESQIPLTREKIPILNQSTMSIKEGKLKIFNHYS